MSRTAVAEKPDVFTDPAAVVAGYVAGVLDGTVPAARLVIAAVRRHVHDLEHGEERGLWFDEEAATRAVKFFGFLRHWKGEWGQKLGKPGQRFALSPWQAFMTWCIFGWKRADGTRRYRTAYIEIPRKNGKTSWLAGVGLYMLMGDGEPGAEVYSFATKKDQARIVAADAAAYIGASESLRSRLHVSGGRYVNNISFAKAASKWEPIGADSKTSDGLNASTGLGDELHEHPSSAMWDVIETATGARQQPLMLGITTAGADPHSFCGQLHDYAVSLLEGFDKDAGAHDDTFFAFISAAEKDEDWTDPAVWARANPNYGVSVKPAYMQDKLAKAKAMPSSRNEFLRKNLNIWTEQVELWIPIEQWDGCEDKAFDPSLLVGRECLGGLDLSSKLDLTAYVQLFPPTDDDPFYRVLPHFWIPEETAAERERVDRIHYREWADRGLLTLTPGNVVDYDFVMARIVELNGHHPTREIAYDPWNATQVASKLQDEHGFTMQEFRQGMVSMNEPCKEFERLVASKEIRHDGNAVLRWMMGNAAVKRDESGNIRPVKPLGPGQQRKRVDGVIATVMALGRAILNTQGADVDVAWM